MSNCILQYSCGWTSQQYPSGFIWVMNTFPILLNTIPTSDQTASCRNAAFQSISERHFRCGLMRLSATTPLPSACAFDLHSLS